MTAASHEMLSDYTYITNFIVQGYEDQFKWERYTVIYFGLIVQKPKHKPVMIYVSVAIE